MLVAALVVTVVGFVLLVVALITSSVAFAWACIVICLVGFGLLIADVLGLRKGGEAAESSSSAMLSETEADQGAVVDQGVGLSEQPVEEQVSSTADETPVAELDSLGQAEDSRFGAADSVGWQSDRDT